MNSNNIHVFVAIILNHANLKVYLLREVIMENKSQHMSAYIAIAMLLGIILGLATKLIPGLGYIYNAGLSDALELISIIFINLLKMIVMPVVFFSLVNGIISLQDSLKLGRICILSLVLYLATTAMAISIALTVATYFNIGAHANLGATLAISIPEPPTFYKVVLAIFPTNIISALAQGNMLQVLFLAVFIGSVVLQLAKNGVKTPSFFGELNAIVMGMVGMVMRLAPIGVFCLLVGMVNNLGVEAISYIIDYFMTVVLVLALQLFVSYHILLRLFTNIRVKSFLTNMRSAMLFAFSVSSSSASIPIVMQTAKDKLKLSQSVVSFVVPLGATVNMDGTAIMQGVATVFIANAYGVDLSASSYLTIIAMATMASIGTAGVPGVGMITLAMVLSQVGLPVEGISMIIGIDRLLDMLRTAINICGDCVVACIVNKFCIDNKPQ
jgi:Na+/H+-dicarboxylate symporter